MIDGYVEKSPTELKTFEADFATEIPSGDSITTGTATATDSTGAAAASLITSATISGTKIIVKLAVFGTDGMDYKITVKATMTTAATVFEKYYEVRVRAGRRTF